MARIEQISDDDVEMVDTAEQEGSWDEDYHDAPSDIQPEPGPFQVPFGVQVPSVRNPETYDIFPAEFRVRAIRKQVEEKGVSYCITQFEDGHVAKILFDNIIALENGAEAFAEYASGLALDETEAGSVKAHSPDSPLFYESGSNASDDEDLIISDLIQSHNTTSVRSSTKKAPPKKRSPPRRKVEKRHIDLSSEEQSIATVSKRSRRSSTRRSSNANRGIGSDSDLGVGRRRSSRIVRKSVTLDSAEESSEQERPTAATRRTTRSAGSGVQHRMLSYRVNEPDGESDSDDIVTSDLIPRVSKGRQGNRKRRNVDSEEEDESDGSNLGARRSGRTSHRRNTYREPGADDDDFEREVIVKISKPKVTAPKENFPVYDEGDEFVQFHRETCDTCQISGDSSEKGHLVYCQGCSFSYHTSCIGYRTAREHLVTKVSEDAFVLQCRRCIGRPRMKDNTAPRYDRCTNCRVQGAACAPFKPIKMRQAPKTGSTAATPEAEVPPDLVNNAENVLFRCVHCMRAYHFDHLPSRNFASSQSQNLSKARLREYRPDWTCLDCWETSTKIQAIIAWRPADLSSFDPEAEIEDFGEDEREYLIKFEKKSYFQCKWMPGAWVWGKTLTVMRQTFTKKFPQPKRNLEEAVDPEFLRVEIILDLRFTSVVPVGKSVEVDLRRIKEVEMAFVKYRGLTYDDVVWEVPPAPQATTLWKDFEKAYVDWVHGQYIHMPKGTQKKIEKIRAQNFKQMEKKTQPKYIVGGTLMPYQLEGVNWLHYKWWKGENAILADEMGLGKTIQIISFLSVLHREHKVWPFLIVVPHSTVPNWKREIQSWNLELRVVAYFGSQESRRLARKYEMFHSGGRDLKCHVVVTSYSAPIDDANILKAVPWEGMIVDEGQRLKNDASLLYKTLASFKIKHKVLLTGTPLQNNPRELFNLLQFLNPKEVNAAQLEEKYGELTKENVPELHNMIRPYFLRRTKAAVLTMLPPMAEIIVPVTMTTVQTKLYKSILSKDAALIKSILARGSQNIKNTEKAKLGNILMQLRKCLCHPFIYSDEIEEKTDDPEESRKNLTEACAKLQLLLIMLPKLKERGHRVLIFSQFLGMLDIVEDFLDGLGLRHVRLDGSVPTLEKQKRIDAYNAPDSPLFAFLLSTRAGGVGINLATADTVIILDPDFNPHQDLQALSRAHRIGQKKKVLVFHLMTRDTAEEKIMQLGKKKLSLDHLIIDRMGAEQDEAVDVESILKFGAGALFDDTHEARAIKYDAASVDALIDRSQMEQTTGSDDKENSAETAFSFARVWANDKGTLDENLLEDKPEHEISEEAWERILQQREEEARKEREARMLQEDLGRGRRTRHIQQQYLDEGGVGGGSGDDTDFRAPEGPDSESDWEQHQFNYEEVDQITTQRKNQHNIMQQQQPQRWELPQELPGSEQIDLQAQHLHTALAQQFHVFKPQKQHQQHPPLPLIAKPSTKDFKRVHLPSVPQATRDHFPIALERISTPSTPPLQHEPQPHQPHTLPVRASSPGPCKACQKHHPPGSCPLRFAGVEFCPLCGIAHYGRGPVCPHLGSETQIKIMMAALRESDEDPVLVAEALKYLRGRKGAQAREKREKARKAGVPIGGPVGAGPEERNQQQQQLVVMRVD